MRERGELTNREIRRFSGYSRTQLYRIVKSLEAQCKLHIVGHGRGAKLVPGDND